MSAFVREADSSQAPRNYLISAMGDVLRDALSAVTRIISISIERT